MRTWFTRVPMFRGKLLLGYKVLRFDSDLKEVRQYTYDVPFLTYERALLVESEPIDDRFWHLEATHRFNPSKLYDYSRVRVGKRIGEVWWDRDDYGEPILMFQEDGSQRVEFVNREDCEELS